MDNKKLELYQNLLLKKKIRGLNDLYFFNKYILEANQKRQNLIVPHVHGAWSAWYHGSKKKIRLLLVPRNSFKTTFITIGGTLQRIAKDRNTRILLANATIENSQRFLTEIKEHLRKNENYRLLYGETYDPSLKWNENEITVTGRTVNLKEATVTTTGVGGNLVSQHYDTIYCDDLVNLENSATKYQSDKVIDWWKRSFSLLDPDGEMIVVGTIWSHYDLYAYIIEKLKNVADIYVHSVYNKDGSLYFPERFSEEKLAELKELHGSYIYSSFYLLNPQDEDIALIKKSQIKYYEQAPKNIFLFMVSDPAVSQEVGSDYSAILVCSIDVDDNWYVLKMVREKLTTWEFIEHLFSLNKVFKPLSLSVETISQAQGLLDVIHAEENKRKEYLPLVEIKSRPPISKTQRIRSILQPRFEQGKIFIKQDMVELEHEILKFPHAKHDDAIDCLSDLAEIGFSPKGEEKRIDFQGTKLEAHLAKIYSKNKEDYFDETLGEYF